MSSPLVRCFWAVRPPEENLEQVGQLVRLIKRPLASLGLQIAWTPPEAYHFTLKFLGNVQQGQLGAMVAQVHAQLRHRSLGATVRLAGLGVFPGPQRPQGVYVDDRLDDRLDDRKDPRAEGTDSDWAPAEVAPTGLQVLNGLLEDWLAPLGYARDERPFHPHLTIGRVRGIIADRHPGLQAALHELLQRYTFHRHGAAFPVEELILYESQLTPSGPKYTPLFRLPLASPPAAAAAAAP